MSHVCGSCKAQLNLAHGFVAVDECSHDICSECCLRIFAECPRDEEPACPECGACINRYFFRKQQQGPAVRLAKPVDNLRKNPNPKRDPVRAMFKECKTDVQGQGLLHLSFGNKLGNLKSYNCRFKFDDGFALSEESEGALLTILAVLSKQLYSADFKENRQFKTKRIESMTDFMEHAFDDRSLRWKAFYAFATSFPGLMYRTSGENIVELSKETTALLKQNAMNGVYRANYLRLYASFDLFLGFFQNSATCLMKNLGETIFAYTSNKTLIDLLSSFRLSESYSTMRRKAEARMTDFMQNAHKLQRRSFLVFASDNLNFHVLGSSPGTIDWTVMVVHEVSYERLKQVQAHTLSRESVSFESIVEEAEDAGVNVATKIVIPNDLDYNYLSFYVLRHGEKIIDLKLPSADECEQMIQDSDYNWSAFDAIPRNLGIDLSLTKTEISSSGKRSRKKLKKYADAKVSPAENIMAENAAQADNADNVDSASFLSKNGTIIDIPLLDNQGSNAAIHRIFNYMNDVCDRKIKADRSTAGDRGEEPVQDILRPFCADGSPIYAGGKIKDETVNEGTYRLIDLFLGGFHLLLETINKKSELVEDLARFIASQYRTTTKRQDWVLFPTDPNQAQDETIPVYTALWRAAIDACKKNLGVDAVTIPQVHHFMLERAKQKPIATMMLIEMRLQEICFMLRDAEKCRSLDLFISALRLAQTVFAVTGAYKYVRICCDLLVWFETASTACKVVVENFVFTQLTADGKSMFTDRFQEKINRIFRREMGKIALPGHERKMYKVAARLESIQSTIEEEKSVKNLAPTKPTKEFNESEASEDNLRKVYASVYAAVAKANIWGGESDDVLVFPNGTKRPGKIALKDKLQAPSGKLLNARLLSFFKIALERLDKYFEDYFIEDAFAVSRSTADLKRIVLSTTRAKASQDREILLATSTDTEKIIKAAGGKKAPIVAEIERSFERIANVVRLPLSIRLYQEMETDELRKKKVRQLAEILVLVRKYISKQGGSQRKEERRFAAIAEEEATTTMEERAELLKHPFFKLDDGVLAQFSAATIP